MSYQELYAEYSALTEEKATCRKSLSSLKDGYISTKTISGKKYSYWQYRVDGKLISEYIKEDDVAAVKNQLTERLRLTEQLKTIDERLEKIESAAKILDPALRRELMTLRRCASMEALPVSDRQRSLAFGSAMTALEGIPASKKTEENLLRWASGEYSFQKSFMDTLKAYHLVEV